MLDREREKLFAIRGNLIEDARVIDLFSGTGAIGFEALSRGARLSLLIRMVSALRGIPGKVPSANSTGPSSKSIWCRV